MRKPRNRRSIRKNRPHSKQHYNNMASRIQDCFRNFCKKRYETECLNYSDTDFISMNPVSNIPRDLLFVTSNRGYDARELFIWMLRTNVDPITREKFSEAHRKACADHLISFINRSRKTQLGRVGFFSTHRGIIDNLKKYAKHPKNGRVC